MVMDTEDNPQGQKSAQPISWTASEFANGHKDVVWYSSFIAALLVICGLIFAITNDLMATVAIFVAGLLFLAMAVKKPRSLQYSIDEKGLNIGDKFYGFLSFKSFNLVHSNGITSIDFIPMKRFATEISIFLPPDQGQEILDVIAKHLPHDERDENKIDKWTKKLKF